MGIFNKLFGSSDKKSRVDPPKKNNFTPSNKLMDEDLFWKIIRTAKERSKGDFEKQIVELAQSLRSFEPQDIILFDNRFYYFKNQAYTWELWGAIYLIRGGCGDDSFNDFREWVIGQGKDFYYGTIQDPDSLVDLDEDEILTEWEGLGYVPSEIFNELTGQEIPSVPQENQFANENGDPTGKEWEEEDLKHMFPKLSIKYPDNV